MPSETDLLLAKTLVEQGTVSQAVISECLAKLAQIPERSPGEHPSLGALLVGRGLLTREHLQITLRRETPQSRPGNPGSAPVPPEIATAPPGARFGKYVRISKLGSGGMGEVWRAWDTELSRWIALKFLKGEDEQEIARFKQEAQLAGRLSHPNIAAIYDVGEDRDRHFIAMQFVDGKSLRGLPRDDLRLSARVLRDAARGVHYANSQGIVHRDLKPENLMITTRSGAEPHAYVMDFGLARATAGASNLSVSGFVVGTPSYMPPEQARGEKVDARADVYSLGATLYELIAGRPPFEAPSVLEILKKVTEEEPPLLEGELGTIAAKAMEKDPARRYASVAEFADDLDHFLSGEAILARRASILYRARKRLAKRKALITALAAGLALALALTVYYMPRLRKSQRFAAAYDTAMGRVNEFGLAAATMSDRRFALATDAVRALEEATGIDDRRPMAWVWLGRCRRALGEDAATCWERALAVDPSHPEALLERSGQEFEAYRKSRGESQAGFTSYRQHVSYQPLRRETPQEAALRRRAEADLQAARKAGLRGHLAAYLESLSAFAREDYAAGERLLDEYLDQAAWDASARLLRARTRRYQQKYAEAEKDCRRVLEFQEKNGEARLLLGLLQRDQHRPEEALKELLAARELVPTNLQLLHSLSCVYTDLNRFDEAVAAATKALEINGRFAPALRDRGWANHSRGRLTEAELDYTRSIELEPEIGHNWSLRAFLRQQANRYDEALKDYDTGIKLDPSDPADFNNRGALFTVLKRYPEALADFERAIAIDDQLGAAHYGKAEVLALLGREKESEAALTRGLELRPGDALLCRLRAGLRHRLGLFAGGIEDWRRTFQLEPGADQDYPRLWIWTMRSRIGEREAATAELRLYLKTRNPKPGEEGFVRTARLLTGGLSRDEFLKGATSADTPNDRRLKCEAGYYAGIVLLVEGDAAGARELFRLSTATELRELLEYQAAEGELKRMGR